MVNKKKGNQKRRGESKIFAASDIGCLSHRKDTTIFPNHNTIRQKNKNRMKNTRPNNQTTRKTSKPQNLTSEATLKPKKNESLSPNGTGGLAILMLTIKSYSCGPAATSALPASLVVYFAKFLMKRAARSFAFSSH